MSLRMSCEKETGKEKKSTKLKKNHTIKQTPLRKKDTNQQEYQSHQYITQTNSINPKPLPSVMSMSQPAATGRNHRL